MSDVTQICNMVTFWGASNGLQSDIKGLDAHNRCILVGMTTCILSEVNLAPYMRMGRGTTMDRTLGSRSREPGFEFSCCHFVALTIFFTLQCHSLLSCINMYLATDRGGYLNE